MNIKKYFFIFVCFNFLFCQFSFAGRLGGGKSFGMQRSSFSNTRYTNTNTNRPSYGFGQGASNSHQGSSYQEHQTQPAYGNNQQPRSGMGAGSAALLGAAAGAVGGYMLGKNSSNEARPVAQNGANNTMNQPNGNQANVGSNNGGWDNRTNSVDNANKSSFPWGIVAILVILLIIGLMIFRKKNRLPEYDNKDINATNYSNNQGNTFNIPNVNGHHGNQANANSAGINNNVPPSTNVLTGNANQAQQIVEPSIIKMPDGVETIYFLRQAKGIFLHVQSMNNTENINEISKYFTPEMYEVLKNEIVNNQYVADFPTLDCQLLDSKLEQNGSGGNGVVASVRFIGTISEEPNVPAKAFSEIWNFIKPDISANKWLVAGIQQEI